MGVKIRKAKEEDAETIARINIQSWQDTYKGIFPDEFLESLNSKFEDTVQKCMKKIHEYIVALEDGQVVGFVRFGKNKKDYSDEYGEIYAIYIDSSFRGKKIGEKLLKYSFDEMSKSFQYCLISTLVQNRANHFYLRNGGIKISEGIFPLMNKEYIENVYLFKL